MPPKRERAGRQLWAKDKWSDKLIQEDEEAQATPLQSIHPSDARHKPIKILATGKNGGATTNQAGNNKTNGEKAQGTLLTE